MYKGTKLYSAAQKFHPNPKPGRKFSKNMLLLKPFAENRILKKYTFVGMRNLNTSLFAVITALFLFSCGDKKPATEQPATDTVQTAAKADPSVLLGEYIGDFGEGHIVVVLSYIQGKNASGYNVHKGLKRNIKGSYAFENKLHRFRLDEPGDHPYDGKFDISLNAETLSGEASWTPNDASKVSAKKFKLDRRERNPDTDNFFIGYWDGQGMLEITEDGMAKLTYWEALDKTEENYERREMRGQWIAKGDEITIDWPSNTYTKGEKYVLKKTEDEDGIPMLRNASGSLEFYQY